MKNRAILMALFASAVTLGGCNMKKESEGDEMRVPMDQVPAAVKATLAREAPGVTIATVDVEKNEGKTVYEADALIGGNNYEIKVAPDGTLISKTADKEAEGKKSEGKESESSKK